MFLQLNVKLSSNTLYVWTCTPFNLLLYHHNLIPQNFDSSCKPFPPSRSSHLRSISCRYLHGHLQRTKERHALMPHRTASSVVSQRSEACIGGRRSVFRTCFWRWPRRDGDGRLQDWRAWCMQEQPRGRGGAPFCWPVRSTGRIRTGLKKLPFLAVPENSFSLFLVWVVI